MAKHRLLQFCLFILFLASGAAHAGFEGEFSGQMQGHPVHATLSVADDQVEGPLIVDDYAYRVEARVDGTQANGWLLDQQTGGRLPLAMILQGETIAVSVQGGVLSFRLQPGTASAAAPPPGGSPGGGGERDPNLVGSWSRSESYSSGGFSAASQTSMVLMPDGTYRYGNTRVVGGGSLGGFDTGGGGGVETGRWKTSQRIIYIQEAGSPQWQPYARYYVEPGKLMFTFADGSREIWYRQ